MLLGRLFVVPPLVNHPQHFLLQHDGQVPGDGQDTIVQNSSRLSSHKSSRHKNRDQERERERDREREHDRDRDRDVEWSSEKVTEVPPQVSCF